MLQDGMLLYHGSYAEVEHVDLSLCSDGKDFGKGFYMTSSLPQARDFIPTSLLKAKSFGRIPENQNYGYVSVFRFHAEASAPVYEFSESATQWLWFISQNRRKKLAAALSPHIDAQICKAKIITGKVANDKTNPVITAYLNGLYGDITSERAIRFAIEELMPEHLNDQICFLSKSAVTCLEFIGAEKYVVK